MASTRCGMSAKQLEREIGVTYKCAWRMFHLIRTQLMGQETAEPLEGVVETDETFVGGKPRKADRARMILQSYVDEYAFHYNYRTAMGDPDPFRVLVARANQP